MLKAFGRCTPVLFDMALESINAKFMQVIFRLGGDKHQRFIHIYLNWKRIVGDLLSERSHPLKLERDTLFVGVENSTWMQELILLKPKIIQKYQNALGENLQDIVFIIKSKRKKKK